MIAEGNSTQARTGPLAQARRRTCRRAEMPVADRDASFPGPSRAGHGPGSQRSATVKPPSGLRATPHRPWRRAARSRRLACHEAHFRGPRRYGAGPDSRGYDRLDPMLSRFSTGVFTAPVAIGASIARRRTIGGGAGPPPSIANSIRPWWLSLRPAPVPVARMGEKRHPGLLRFLPPFAAWLG
jgi:hypothetical protein